LNVRGPGSNRQRIRARRCAVQALYQWQLSGQAPREILEEFVAERELIDVDIDYFSTLTRNIPEEFSVLLADLGEVLDREWARVDPVERSVLLIGAYELRFCPQLPWRVVINEGVELSKMFGSADGYRYVNGILDKLARRLRRAEITAAEQESK
jgi:N utilization substance protein B